MIDSNDPRQNFILKALPMAEYQRLFPYLVRVELPLGKVLYEPGDTLSFAYFPTTSVVSLVNVLQNGSSAEIAVIGNDGMLCVVIFMSGETMPNRAVVQSAGYAYKIRKDLLMREFERSGGRRTGKLRTLLMRFTQALVSQMAQTGVCNRYHSVDQRLCRLLLFSLDRLPSNDLYMTQESIANMLGVRREGVTEAAGKLQKAGLIEYRRGRIKVLNRPGLEEKVCECYQVVKIEYNRLLSDKVSSLSDLNGRIAPPFREDQKIVNLNHYR